MEGQGWWRRPGRFFCPPVAAAGVVAAMPVVVRHKETSPVVQPILITGASGTLGSAFARICENRHLAYHLLSRMEMDIADLDSVERVIAHYKPWAIINACGYVRVDDAEKDIERCFRENVHGPSLLARVCARHGIQLLTFSSDLVFDGRQHSPYVETDAVAPLNVYGRSKAESEQKVLDSHPDALVIRTSAFFGPWDRFNFVTQALQSLSEGKPFAAACDITVSPTYVPDLVNACLDLVVDKERGIWHLTNSQPVTWAELALKASIMAGVDSSRLEARPSKDLGYVAVRPTYSALLSERGILLPALDDALSRYLHSRQQANEEEVPGLAAQS